LGLALWSYLDITSTMTMISLAGREPLSPPDARRLIRAILAAGEVVSSKHAADEMAKDDRPARRHRRASRVGARDLALPRSRSANIGRCGVPLGATSGGRDSLEIQAMRSMRCSAHSVASVCRSTAIYT